jgi:hypothetical protein
VSHCATVHREALEQISYTPIFKNLLALHDGGSSSRGGDGMSGSSSQTLWGSQSRLFPGMRLPLFPGSGNDDKADLGAGTFLSNPIPRIMEEGPEPEDLEMSDTAFVEETSSNEKPEQSDGRPAKSDEHSVAISESSPPLLPLPSVALRSGIVFVRTGESRDGNEEQIAGTTSNATTLKSELDTGSGDSGAETGLASKRKREDEDDSDLGDADARAQPRLKLDGVVPEATEPPLAPERYHSPLVDNSDNSSDHDDTSHSNTVAASGNSNAVPDDHITGLAADNNITDGQSNTDSNRGI